MRSEAHRSKQHLWDPILPTYLDAGPDLVFNGARRDQDHPGNIRGLLWAYVAIEPSVYIEPGSYSVANGSGGANVGRSARD